MALDPLYQRAFDIAERAQALRMDVEYLERQAPPEITTIRPGTYDRPGDRYYIALSPSLETWGYTAAEAWERAGSGPALFYLRGAE